MLRTALLAFFCYCFFCSHAQNTENDRARDWLKLNQLGALAGLDSSFLSVTEKKQLQLLEVDHSPAASCAKGSQTDCSGPGVQQSGLKLSGTRLSNELVKLDWETTTELNSNYFVLERRSLTDTLRYDSIAYAAGQGTSFSKTKYTHTDQNNLQTGTYYRVKEVNLDGTFFYSNTVLIYGNARQLTLLVVPNPGTASTTGFYFSGTPSPTAMFTIMNSAGATVVKEQRANIFGSNTFVSLAPYHLRSGMYVLTVYTDHEQKSQRFIIVRD